MSEENKAIARRFWEEAHSTGNLAIVPDIVSPDYVRATTRGRVVRGIERGVEHNIGVERRGFPDFRVTVEETIAEGDRVVARLTGYGTHQGEFHGIPPTGVEVTFTGVSIFRIVEGKIVEEWRKWDMMELLEQLGAAPAD